MTSTASTQSPNEGNTAMANTTAANPSTSAQHALRIGGWANLAIAAAHLIGLIWAWSMFRAVGIEEDMREFANQGAALPYILTLITAAGFAVFGLYALAGAGDLRRPPLLRAGLACIAAIYIYRATWGTGAVADRDGAQIAFAVIALGVGLCYAYGAMPGVRSRATAAASTDRVL